MRTLRDWLWRLTTRLGAWRYRRRNGTEDAMSDDVRIPASGRYVVQRRGRPSADWRELTSFPPYSVSRGPRGGLRGVTLKSPERAWRAYEREQAKVRQGEIRLVAPDGRVLRYYSAPMARTRW